MKFYRQRTGPLIFWSKIKNNYITAIYVDSIAVTFYKNGNIHNLKNAADIKYNGLKSFYMDNICYSYENNFTKHSWRRFVKLQVFF
jgi:hypothetical protein